MHWWYGSTDRIGWSRALGIIVDNIPVRRVVRDTGHDTGNHSDEVFLVFVDADTLCYVILDNFIGVALIEELCKMKAAKWAAWEASGLQL